MKKVLIYPFTEEMAPFVKQENLLKDIDITSIVSLKGNGILGDKYKFNGKSLEVSENFDKELEKCTYILLNNFYSDESENIILENIKKAVNHGKKIIFFSNSNSNIDNLKMIIPKEQQFEINSSKNMVKDFQGRIYNIDTPVIFVCSIFEGLEKFDIQLALRNKLLIDGYKVLQIGTRQVCELFDFYSFPEFMYSNNIEEQDKVLMFNNTLKKLELEKKPDLIIIGIPGGILPFSSKAFGDFGITMYKVLQAVTPDCTILSIPYGKYSDEEISYFGKITKSKFNIEVDYYNIAAKSILSHPTETMGKPFYLTLGKSLVEKKIATLQNKNVFCLSNKSEIDRLIELMIKEFIKYGTVASI